MVLVSVLTVMTVTLAVPLSGHQCTRLSDNRVDCGLPSHIQSEMSEPTCNAQWSINNVSVAGYDSGTIEFVNPVIKATLESVTLETCRDSMVFDISCTKTGFIKQLLFSCPIDGTPVPSKGISSGVSPFVSPCLLLTIGITIIFI